MSKWIRESFRAVISVIGGISLHCVLTLLVLLVLHVIFQKPRNTEATIFFAIYFAFAVSGATIGWVDGFKWPLVTAPISASLTLCVPLIIAWSEDTLTQPPETEFYFVMPAVVASFATCLIFQRGVKLNADTSQRNNGKIATRPCQHEPGKDHHR
jgi:glucose dehydrogenase